MKTGYTYVQRTLCALLLFTLITAVTLAGGTGCPSSFAKPVNRLL